MIRELLIENFIFISRSQVELAPGLCIISGDSGAGKSVIIQAIRLLFERKSPAFIRPQPTAPTVISAHLEIATDQAPALLALLGLPAVPATTSLEIRRTIGPSPKQRSLITVNGQPVKAEILEQIAHQLLVICDQRYQHQFIDRANHLPVLDAFAGTIPQATALAQLWRQIQEVARQLANLEEQLQRWSDGDETAAMIAEIERLAPTENEEMEIVLKRRDLQTAYQSRSSLEKVVHILDERGENALAAQLRTIAKNLAKLGEVATPWLVTIDECTAQLQEIGHQIKESLYRIDDTESQIADLDQRLSSLRETAHRYRMVNPDGLIPLLLEGRRHLQAIATTREQIAHAQTQLQLLQAQYHDQATTLSARRHQAIPQLESGMRLELDALAMQSITFTIAIQTGDTLLGGTRGRDDLEFTFQRQQGTKTVTSRLKHISGGELSRIALGLHGCLAATSPHHTFIFDEIDTGVSGKIASSIGQRLHALAHKGRSKQIIAITHLPQVAAWADHHILVSGALDSTGHHAITAQLLDYPSRTTEVARMIAGQTINDSALAAADQLLKDASEGRQNQ